MNPLPEDLPTKETCATEPENTADSATSSVADELIAICVMKFFMKDGRDYDNHLIIPFGQIQEVRANMLNSLENGEEKVVLTLDGSRNNAYDFTAIPIRNISYFQFIILEVRKK